MPQECLNVMLRHVSRHGWNNCFLSDDCLATKKLYPGALHKCTKPGWEKRLQVTDSSWLSNGHKPYVCSGHATASGHKCCMPERAQEKSLLLQFETMDQDWQCRPPHLRRKMSKREMEECSEMAALVMSIYDEALRCTPLQAEDLEPISTLRGHCSCQALNSHLGGLL